MSGVRLVAWLGLMTVVQSNSLGVGMPCDVDFAVGSPGRVENDNLAMWWVLPATFAGDKYTLRTSSGGDKSLDSSTYTPDRWTDLFISTAQQNKQYTGLLLYAEDGNGRKVGNWSIPDEASFQVAPSGCVTHRNAMGKAYLSKFRLMIPEGTGPVAIKALVKYGLAFPVLKGAFYWPNDAHLMLTEGTPPLPSLWYQGKVGQSCDAVCLEQSMSCDQVGMANNSLSAPLLSNAVGDLMECDLPLLPGCGAHSPSLGTEGCFYHDNACDRAYLASDPRTATITSCSAVSANPQDGRRLCLCKPGLRGNPLSPEGLSGACRVGAVWPILAVLASMTMFGMSGKHCGFFLLLLGLCVLPQAQAHNWLTSPSRGNMGGQGRFRAFMTPPCPQASSRAHVQVEAGQLFPVEWAVGHGHSTYLIVVNALDQHKMNRHTVQMLDKYISDAPSSADYLPDHKAMHVRAGGGFNHALINKDVTADYPRPSIFDPSKGSPKIYSKTAKGNADDFRVQYTNADFPWLISVSKFKHQKGINSASSNDMVMMDIPLGSAPGKYVVQYVWNGYYDCMDVNVLPGTSTDLWGGPEGGPDGYSKVDHCLQPPTSYSVLAKCVAVPSNDGGKGLRECMQLCTDRRNCHGVQLAPWILDPTAIFRGDHPTAKKHLPAQCQNAPRGTDMTDTGLQMCWTARLVTAPEVGPPERISFDPLDPTFYSTCYMRQKKWKFQQPCLTCNPPPPKADFRFGEDMCISCEDKEKYLDINEIPFWKFANKCEHCDNMLG